ncbi:MAG: hypothetical protein ACXWT0_00380 [Methylobacter sp.]
MLYVQAALALIIFGAGFGLSHKTDQVVEWADQAWVLIKAQSE